MKKILLLLCLSFAAVVPAAVLHTASGGKVKTLDPVLADDLASRDITALVFDTLLQYDYTARPYKLVPSRLSKMPEVSADFRTFKFELRDDLYFADDPVFEQRRDLRKVTAYDVKFSILRFADIRNYSPVYWMFRGKIAGLEKFRAATRNCRRSDWSVYDRNIAGITIYSPRHFTITLEKPDPRFLYILAMPNAGIVSRRAVEFYGVRFRRHPVGSGPFKLKRWYPNLKVEFVRNPDYREEYFSAAAAPGDRKKPLPLLDGVNVYQIAQSMTAWMLFLQGNLDINVLDKDNLEQLTFGGRELIPALKARQIKLLNSPEFEVRYIGFNFDDPKLGGNLKLRQALSLSYDVSRRVRHASGQLVPAHGAVPPGVAGHDPEFRNPFARYDLEAAKRLLAEAGYPGGIDPETGKALTLTFDQAGSSTAHRQMGELARDDWSKLGINVVSELNSRPRFFEKLRLKKFQLFRLSWSGDYPDAENFLQLFYSGNRNSCNRCGFSDPEFDRLYEQSAAMAECPERTRLYEKMVELLSGKCAWIYEGFPLSSSLYHAWLQNYLPHDFGFVRWKYLNVDEAKKRELKKSFRPLRNFR